MRWLTRLALLPVLALALSACGPTPTTRTIDTMSAEERNKYPPCHPGCFPAGTLVVTPSGLREIQTVCKGEVVTLVTADGTTATGTADDVFTTPNWLIEVRTDGGTVATTETQPLSRTTGEFVLAGDLKPGDTIWRWEDGGRKAATVKEVTAPVREADVFNLVVGKDKVFIAGGFLARGKPPAER